MRSLRSKPILRSGYAYDPDSGLGYNETVLSASAVKLGSQWTSRSTTGKLIVSKSEQGAPTLRDTATRQVLRHLESLTEEVLAGVPWVVARGIWAQGKKL